MGTIHGFFARSQASAIWAGVAFFCSAKAGHQVDQSLVGLAILRAETRNAAAEVRAVEFRIRVDLAGEKAFAERAEGNEPNAELFKGGHHGLLRLPPEQRVLTLQCGNGLNRVGAANGLRTGLGETKVLHLCLPGSDP